MTVQKKQNNDANGYIILDTNILIKLGEDSKKKSIVGEEILSYLSLILSENAGWYLAISAITNYELINQSSVETELAREKMLKGIKCFIVTLPVIRIAGRLSCFYSQLKIPDEQIEIPDKIIGGTAMQTGSVICTTNPSDYPAPFFSELKTYRKIIEHPNKHGYPTFVPIYIMVPEKTIFSSYYKSRISPITKKKKR